MEALVVLGGEAAPVGTNGGKMSRPASEILGPVGLSRALLETFGSPLGNRGSPKIFSLGTEFA